MTKGTDDTGLIRLDDEECWRFLEDHWLGRVALVHQGSPMVFPVNYALDGRSVVFRTAPGTKLSLAGANRPVAFEVDQATPMFETGTSVVVHGHLERVVDAEELRRVDRLRLRTWAPARDHVVRVVADHVTGRRIDPQGVAEGIATDGG